MATTMVRREQRTEAPRGCRSYLPIVPIVSWARNIWPTNQHRVVYFVSNVGTALGRARAAPKHETGMDWQRFQWSGAMADPQEE